MIEDYKDRKIIAYSDFATIVEDVGFMPLSNNRIGFINLDILTESKQWHTDLPSDPWPWRMKIESDHKAAYAKLFDKKPGFISLEWYPKFLAARRDGRSFSRMYSEGLMSNYSKRIYDLFKDHEILAAHEIKALGGFTKETNAKYESAMSELQMAMFITVNGSKQKISSKGEPYGWPSTAYSTVEMWAGEEIMDEANSILSEDAKDEILKRIREFAPEPPKARLKAFTGF